PRARAQAAPAARQVTSGSNAPAASDAQQPDSDAASTDLSSLQPTREMSPGMQRVMNSVQAKIEAMKAKAAEDAAAGNDGTTTVKSKSPVSVVPGGPKVEDIGSYLKGRPHIGTFLP